MLAASTKSKTLRPVLLIGLALAGIALVWAVSSFIPPGHDFEHYYLPAARVLLSLENPYRLHGFYNPVWALFPLVPLAALPPQLGSAILFVSGLAAFAYTAFRLGAKPAALVVFLLSSPVMFCLYWGQLDWLALLGLVLPPQIGLFFVLIKPQVGAVIALFWLFQAWRTGGVKKVVQTFLPVTLAFGISFLVFGFWPLQFLTRLEFRLWNYSMWPLSIPFGLAFLWSALRKSELRLAMIGSPLLSPYVGLQSYSMPLLGLVSDPPLILVASIGSWVAVFLPR